MSEMSFDRKVYMREYMRKLRAGTVVKLSPIDKLAHGVASERVDALCEASGLKKPKGEQRKSAIERMLTVQKEDIYAEANARKASNEAAAGAVDPASILNV